jgi:phosphoserine phosphatase
MIELLRYLEAHGFVNYIASGGGRDFMRPIAQELYGIPPERVIGSTVALAYRDDGEIGNIVHKPEVEVFDDGPAKPVRIWSRIGRRPAFAAGNSNGDIAMLHFCAHPSRRSLCLLVNHEVDRDAFHRGLQMVHKIRRETRVCVSGRSRGIACGRPPAWMDDRQHRERPAHRVRRLERMRRQSTGA